METTKQIKFVQKLLHFRFLMGQFLFRKTSALTMRETFTE